MCVVCNPAFAEALRKLTFPSRRQILEIRSRDHGRRFHL